MIPLETLRLVVPDDALEAFEAALLTACPTVGFFRDGDSGPWLLEAVKPRGEHEAALIAALALAEAATGVSPPLLREPVDAEGWLLRTQTAFPEQRIGRRFAVRGTHVTAPPAPGRITLVLDAGAAFGSGEHPTTQLCLRALEHVRGRPRRILDLGTGTGVLAMAAARLFGRPAIAADIDAWAVRTARANMRRNAVAARLGVADGWRSAWLTLAGPYDLVLANILARPLRKMARGLAANLAPGGTAILSGLLWRQVAWVAEIHRAHGLVLQQALREADWAALTLRRPHSPGVVR